MILQAKNANPPILPTNLKFRHCLSSLKSSRQIFFHCCPCKCLFCCCHATAFFLLSCSGLTGASPGAFLSVIYCLTRRVRLDRGSFNPDYPIKSGNDSKESKSDNDCKWKPPLQKAERQNKTLSPAGRTPASYT